MINRVADYPRPPAAAGLSASDHPLIRAHDVRDVLQPIEQWIIRNPAAALASALVVGVAVAWWIKRK